MVSTPLHTYYRLVWILWAGVDTMGWCGYYGLVWILWAGVDTMGWCAYYGLVNFFLMFCMCDKYLMVIIKYIKFIKLSGAVFHIL
jgi:hypothetical protein